MIDIDRYAEGTPARLVAECYEVWAREPFPKSDCKMIEAIVDIHDRIDALMHYIQYGAGFEEREVYEFRQVQILAVMHNDSNRFKDYFDRAEWAEDYSQTASWIFFERLENLVGEYGFRWYSTRDYEEEEEYNSEEEWAEDLEDKEIQERAFKTIIARLRSENASLRDELDIDYKEQNDALRAELEALKAKNAGLQAGGDNALREEIKRLRAELETKNDEVVALKDKLPKNGRKPNSGLNRHERTSLLIELIANLSGLAVDTLTGENANIQRQGVPSLGRVCELITNISEGQGTRVVSDLRTGNRVGRDTKLVAERTHLEALLGDIRELKGR